MTNNIEAFKSFVEKQALSEGSIFAIATDKAKEQGYKDFSEGSKGREKRDEIAEAIKDKKVSKAAPGPPPRPGLVWNDFSKRWIRPSQEQEPKNQKRGKEDLPELHYDKIASTAKGSGADPTALYGTIKGISEGKNPTKAFAEAMEDQNFHGPKSKDMRRKIADHLDSAYGLSINPKAIEDISSFLMRSDNSSSLDKLNNLLSKG